MHAQSDMTLCDSSRLLYGTFLTIILDWVAISYSREPSKPRG